jgi:hypothetical protein
MKVCKSKLSVQLIVTVRLKSTGFIRKKKPKEGSPADTGAPDEADLYCCMSDLAQPPNPLLIWTLSAVFWIAKTWTILLKWNLQLSEALIGKWLCLTTFDIVPWLWGRNFLFFFLEGSFYFSLVFQVRTPVCLLSTRKQIAPHWNQLHYFRRSSGFLFICHSLVFVVYRK